MPLPLHTCCSHSIGHNIPIPLPSPDLVGPQQPAPAADTNDDGPVLLRLPIRRRSDDDDEEDSAAMLGLLKNRYAPLGIWLAFLRLRGCSDWLSPLMRDINPLIAWLSVLVKEPICLLAGPVRVRDFLGTKTHLAGPFPSALPTAAWPLLPCLWSTTYAGPRGLGAS
jgi:hypothetical protein